MARDKIDAADSTAVRVALWRAMHVQIDPPPHVLEDEVGLRLAGVGEGWRQRPDMDPNATCRNRASIVGRARLIEDLVEEQVEQGVTQYVILGAGLDTFAQRRADLAPPLCLFEVDQPGPQNWKRQRLIALGFGVPEWLRLVPVDFEAGSSWWDQLMAAGFDIARPAIVASAGVSMYLTRDAVADMLHRLAGLAPGSTIIMSFMPPLDVIDREEQPLRLVIENATRAAGTPFVSFFTPAEMLALARQAGLGQAEHVSAADLAARYFAGRADGLRPSSSEELLIART